MILFEGRWPEVLRPILERKNAIIQVMKGYEPNEGNIELNRHKRRYRCGDEHDVASAGRGGDGGGGGQGNCESAADWTWARCRGPARGCLSALCRGRHPREGRLWPAYHGYLEQSLSQFAAGRQ